LADGSIAFSIGQVAFKGFGKRSQGVRPFGKVEIKFFEAADF